MPRGGSAAAAAGSSGAAARPPSPPSDNTAPAHAFADACWPDDARPGRTVLNDVSRMNATRVAELVQPRTLEDVRAALASARAAGRRVCVRGTKHSMGGQSLVHDGVILDMQWVAHVRYNADRATVTCGTGATWASVILLLNEHGKTPRTLQSYASFSVGGTLSVNGHGITSDHCVAESVVRFTLVRGDGEVIVVDRDGKHAALFGRCLGGYGLFGVIWDVELRVDDNVRLALDVLALPVSDLPATYDSLLGAEDVEMKLTRLDTTTLATADVFVFRRDSPTPTVSALGVKPREMSAASRLMYKWCAGPLREARFALERTLGVALDWRGVSDRNEMLYESAESLARLYSPLVALDDTFVLQEYFVPRVRMAEFIEGARGPIVDGVNREALITLLNITMRFVQQDVVTALPYAAHPSGVFAFVLYFRLRRSPDADTVLRRYHGVLTQLALRLGGTFYLPYRHHYTDAELAQAYPSLGAFCAAQEDLEPSGLFGNSWFDRYRVLPPRVLAVTPLLPRIVAAAAPPAALPPLLPSVRSRRSGSFRALLRAPALRRGFFECFLVDVLALAPAGEVHRLLAAAAWDARNVNDDAVYAALCRGLERRGAAPLAKVADLWAGVQQVSAQKRELTREVVSVLARLGKLGAVHDYASIGDHGKLVLALRRAIGFSGRAWVVHDVDAGEEDTSAVLERGAARRADVGEFVRVDYSSLGPSPLAAIPDASCDLVTLNQGLHHLAPPQVPALLADVRRALRPGGVFILREHDLDEGCSLLPMLDCAHMVFNALTGVTTVAEVQELRAFRPLLEWRAIVEAAGLRDSRVYEMQPHDPTIDVMMAFVKPDDVGGDAVRAPRNSHAALHAAPPAPHAAQLLLNALPGLAVDLGTGSLDRLLRWLPQLRDLLRRAVSGSGDGSLSDTPGLRAAAALVVESYIDPALVMLQRFHPMAAAVQPVADVGHDVLPPELLLLGPALRARAAAGGAVERLLVSLLDRAAAMAASDEGDGGASPAPQPPSDGGRVTEGELLALRDEVLAAFPQLRGDDALRGMGLPPKVETIVRARLAAATTGGPGSGGGAAALAKWLAGALDGPAWAALRGGVRSACAARTPPTLTALLTPGSPWHRAALAVLGCPAVRISRTLALLASGAGLGGVVALWERAQRERRSAAARGPPGHDIPPAVSDAFAAVCPLLVHTVRLGGGVEGAGAPLSGVLAVVAARVEARSLTQLLPDKAVDVTADVASTLNPATGVLHLDRVALPSTRRLGTHSLVVTYRAAPAAGGAEEEGAQPRVAALGFALAAAGLTDASRAGNAAANLYKLPEWLQVEIVQAFGASLEHTPWFRYPFLGTVAAYWRVLGEQVRVVAARHGWEAALTSGGLLTDVAPGIVMAALFSQLALLAYPIRRAWGDENVTELYVEQLVIAAPRGVNWAALDPRVSGVREVAGGLYVLTLPTFKPLTALLLRIARELPAAVVLQLSNHARVHVKVQASAGAVAQGEALRRLARHPGCERHFDFELPHVGGAAAGPPTQASLSVAVAHLLSVLRLCVHAGLRVDVFDFN